MIIVKNLGKNPRLLLAQWLWGKGLLAANPYLHKSLKVINRVVARPILVVGNKSKLIEVHQVRVDQQNYPCLIMKPLLPKRELQAWCQVSKLFVLWGPCNKLNGLWTVLFLFDISYSLPLAVSQINAQWTIFWFFSRGKICAGRHNVFCSECWAKIVSPGQARPPWLHHRTSSLTCNGAMSDGANVASAIKCAEGVVTSFLLLLLQLSDFARQGCLPPKPFHKVWKSPSLTCNGAMSLMVLMLRLVSSALRELSQAASCSSSRSAILTARAACCSSISFRFFCTSSWRG